MVPKTFQSLVGRVKNAEIPPIKEQLELLKKQVSVAEESLKRQMLVQNLCQYLTNGATMAGFFGSCPTCAMFVRQYKTETVDVAGHPRVELVEVDMVIVPDLLVEHVMRVNIPHPTDPNRSTNTPQQVNVDSIVEIMLKHARNAKNVSVGTFADVLCEACAKCGEQAPVAAFDVYLDDDNGNEFTVKRICGSCSQVDLLAYYRGRYERDQQYCITDGIYR